MERHPQNHHAYRLLGTAYGYKGEVDRAVESYKKAIDINPGYVDGYRSLGFAHQYKGDKAKALDAYKKVIELDPDGVFSEYARKMIKKLSK